MQELKINAVNQISKGGCIFQENNAADMVGIVIRGKVLIQNRGICTYVQSGAFIGVIDIFSNRYQSSYIAQEDVVVYIFPVKMEDDLEDVLAINKDYCGLMTASLSRLIARLAEVKTELTKIASEFYNFIKLHYQRYLMEGIKSGYVSKSIPVIDELEQYISVDEIDDMLLEYYCQCSKIPVEVHKAYFENRIICMHHVREEAVLLQSLYQECSALTCYIFEVMECLLSEDDLCFFKKAAQLYSDMSGTTGENLKRRGEVGKIIERLIDKINAVEVAVKNAAGIEISVNHDYLEKSYYEVLSGTSISSGEELAIEEAEDNKEEILKELKNSLEKILRYSEISEEKQLLFKEEILKFKKLEDKASTEDFTRLLRRQLSELYYEIYGLVFIKAYKENNRSHLIDLFLNYGFIDETLLSEEQVLQLYHLNLDLESMQPCKVYSMRDWLNAVYEEDKEPSKSEFDLDYYDALRDEKRLMKLSDAQFQEKSNDKRLKLEYEIKNMLMYNNRVSSGRITTFVPFLYEQVFFGRINKAFHSARDINAALNRFLNVDYSIFYRERLYSAPEKGIKKEYIMEQIFPDIILLPICGSHGVMWQEITGRRRNTPGRFLIPVLTEESLDNIIVQLMGRFRWELCRTIQGGSWNNIQYPSLTSEYYDYIQFYQKNRDLTPEKKEKLKSQIVRGRGNTREVFLLDYMSWIMREANGEIRLNKVARALMATYIPFPKAIRERIAVQPIFSEAMFRFERERSLKVKELEQRKRALEKDNVDIPQDILDTLDFYKEG
ncbi:cyclic nucleotide-binding domain-containing protein [Anaeromicropila populeti]|uniref:Cyclic nucleotide-binding domain-containing protein n=1 Tax=Anaeromicropila populeti TaxID=37658 RepID=A0A1I6LHF5_9FIRM|nr:cyclic nucleotide-binding domain-containing protein [Anaeromicropila populeti]SFS02738.1 Cyclic nucleotide-binding domain-containing protein [Anaeromicropila populeti]